MFNEVIATVGGILLGLCAVPETIKTIKRKRSDHSWWFLLMWFVGDICLLYYGIAAHLPIAIVLNNVLNALCISVIAYHK